MIQLMFEYLNEKIIVVIEGNSVKFGNTAFGTVMADIDGLQLNREGVIKEFPDLKDKEDWELEAKKRFKKKVKSMNSEKEIAEYIISDLKNYGYKPLYEQKKGFRAKVIA